MKIEQFYDEGLAHASYAILSQNEIALIDPARDPKIYYDFAKSNNARIVAVIETHPHADFVSSHKEIASTTGATIYISEKAGVEYDHSPFDEGELLIVGNILLIPIHTPGHSPDSISIILLDEQKKEHAVFTGDTLFVGDVGRPDLRENVGNIKAKKEELAKMLYYSLHNKLMKLPPETLLFPAHGPGSLCGKQMSPELSSTIAKEIAHNYALQPMSEEEFIELLLEDQPFIPKYFAFDVELNKKGAADLIKSIQSVPRLASSTSLQKNILIIDSRPQENYKLGHLKGSINIMDGVKFETWLGSIVGPDEKFYLIADNEPNLEKVIIKTAKVGYENNILGALISAEGLPKQSEKLDLEKVRLQPTDDFTIVDIRNPSEAKEPIFKNSINIPLYELRERISEIPQNKPILVHCAGGYRSAAGSSILENHLNAPIYDLSVNVTEFAKASSQ